MKRSESGLSLIEMMVSITVAMILSIVVLMLFSGQMRTFAQVASKENTEQEVLSASNVLSQLLRQAILCQDTRCTPAPVSIDIDYTVGGNLGGYSGNVLRVANKTVTVDFTIPENYAVWPNNTPPFTNNAIRLSWVEDINQANGGQLTISAAANNLSHTAASTLPLLGNSNLVVTNFDFWPKTATGQYAGDTTCTNATRTGCPYGGYELTITARSNKSDYTYTNTLDANNALGLQKFRTVTLSSNISPHN